LTEEKPIPGRWGTNRKGTQVHFFVLRSDNGKCESLCGRMKQFDKNMNAKIPDLENWDPEDARTCRTCREMRKWFKVTHPDHSASD